MSDEYMPSTRKKALEWGQDRYFTGKPCGRGHTTWRYSYSGKCNVCVKDESKKHHEKNKERLSEQKKTYYAKNRAAVLLRNRPGQARYRCENAQRETERHAAYYRDNKDQILDRLRVHRAEKQERMKLRTLAELSPSQVVRDLATKQLGVIEAIQLIDRKLRHLNEQN